MLKLIGSNDPAQGAFKVISISFDFHCVRQWYLFLLVNIFNLWKEFVQCINSREISEITLVSKPGQLTNGWAWQPQSEKPSSKITGTEKLLTTSFRHFNRRRWRFLRHYQFHLHAYACERLLHREVSPSWLKTDRLMNLLNGSVDS
jgi:hypothetical protein